jgi:alanine racemase
MSEYTRRQLALFNALRARFDPSIPAHASNSAMSLVAPEADFSMIPRRHIAVRLSAGADEAYF